jgi:hypothetical protein
MSERTVVKSGGSLKKLLNNENVFLDFEWTYDLDKEKKKYLNLQPNSSSRSYILQEIERDYPPGIALYSQEDKAGVSEWQKLKDSNTTSPGGKPLAFEKDGKKYVVISEIFNGEEGKTEVVFNSKWFESNTSVAGFEPRNIKNWDRVHNELSIYENGKSSDVFESLENHRISAIKQDSRKALTDPNDFSDTPTLPASDINSSIGFKKSPPPPDGERPPVEDGEPLSQKPEDVDKEERSPVPPETNKVSQKSQSELVDLYYPIDLNVEETDYLLIKSIAYKPVRGAQNNFIRSQGEFPNDLTGGIFSGANVDFGDFTETIGATSRTKNDVVTIQNRKMKLHQELIFLPIPSNIQDGNSVSFGDNSLDALSAGLAGISGTAINQLPKLLTGETDMKEFTNKIGNEMGDLSPTLRRRILDGLKAQAANLAGVSNVSFQSLLARETGGILNPNKELLFNGVSLRTFRFSFKFTPRSRAESEEVRRIIRRLKKKMAPKIGNLNESGLTPSEGKSGHFLQTPNVFELQYMHKKDPHPYLNYFKTCALTDMSMKYTGENTYSTYQDGSPTSMIMDLTFKELEPIYNQDYYLPYNGEPNTNDTDQLPESVGY